MGNRRGGLAAERLRASSDYDQARGDDELYPGIDIIEIERFTGACERRAGLAARLFTERELTELASRPRQTWAGRFAAKEAVLKCLGTGIGRLAWHDVEILASGNGEPTVWLSERAVAKAKGRGGEGVRVSIAHDRTKAVAVAILV